MAVVGGKDVGTSSETLLKEPGYILCIAADELSRNRGIATELLKRRSMQRQKEK
ncbi:MAG: hypothetical protein JRM91_04600 [Nitrososphaerota archaeon]|jgi:ribosomal protein S18 acetylase RimI-like enzyme|nr:hypothetical protein [Nitrososphaerota archaeon]MDG6945920.1 hypothetical protein [Nitrososphaerota archaeon]MDG6949591.1 hypothetical protein [Nitrososphaerota archaeon]